MNDEEICATWADPLDRLAGTLYERDLGIWRAGVQSWQDAERFLAHLARAEGLQGAPYPPHQRIEILCAWRDAEISCRAEADRATGAAFRRLVERGATVTLPVYGGGLVAVKPYDGDTYWADTLPEAVFKALGPVGT